VTQAMRSLGYDRVIGICDTPSSTKLRLANALNLDEGKLHAEFFGLNHLSWIRKLEYEGKDILGDVVNNGELLAKISEFRMFDPELIQSMGYLPNEYLYYYYHREKSVANILGAKATRGKFIEQNNIDMLRELNSMDIDKEPEEALQTYLYYMEKRERAYMAVETHHEVKPLQRGNLKIPDSEGYAGVMMDFAEALVSDSHKEIILSVPNNGSVDGFNDGDVMEVTCTVDKDGAHPAQIGKVPEEMYLLMRVVKLYEKLSVQAAFTKSKDLAVKALMVHPLVNSYSLAKSLVKDYLEAYEDRLGEWH
jgi:6-phospho-beta-glucosidase